MILKAVMWILEHIKAMEKYKVYNLVFSSSATVYGVPESVPLYENSPVQSATSPYGETKVIIERILEDIAKVNPQYNFGILRYFKVNYFCSENLRNKYDYDSEDTSEFYNAKF